MVLVKCLQMPHCQGSTGVQLPIPVDAQVFISDGTAPPEYAIAGRCAGSGKIWNSRERISWRIPKWLTQPVHKVKATTRVMASCFTFIILVQKKKSVLFAHEAEVLHFHFKLNQKIFPPHNNPMLWLRQKTKQPHSHWGRHTACGLGTPLTVMFP